MTVYSYWHAVPFEVPDEDAKAWTRECAKWCQEIDADCNDCLHFRRERYESLPGVKRWIGTCGKADAQPMFPQANGKVAAYPNQYSGNPCFVHRRGAA